MPVEYLSNVVRDYAWGAVSGIPELLGRTPDGTPQAELWIGAHTAAPSYAGARGVTLDELIAADPGRELGEQSRNRFGDTLPFLLKVLAADSALSLQAHPDSEQAERGFDAEEHAGVPRDSSSRNYKDPRHKPEMIYALSRFEALCGFRRPARIRELLGRYTGAGGPAAGVLRARLDAATAEDALRGVLTVLLDGDWTAAVEQIAAESAVLAGSDLPESDRKTYQTVAELAEQYPGDVGVIISLLLHRITLEPGHALMLPAGNMHAYLHGLGIEVMAASDNVLRCGLTSKHIDTVELLHILDFSPFRIRPVEAEHVADGELLTPAVDDFQLQRITVSTDSVPAGTAPRVHHHGPAVAICTEGSVRLTPASGDGMDLDSGDSVYIGAAEPEITVAGTGTVFAATVNGRVATSVGN